ncbi:hypothetical protein ACFLWN_03125 [Chloroflexota bacterium]
MIRTLVLDEDDLIMVVDKNIVHQIDVNRGELTRTEFINFLIHRQLHVCEHGKSYVTREEFDSVARHAGTLEGCT